MASQASQPQRAGAQGKSSTAKLLWIGVAALVGVATMALPTPPGLTMAGQRSLAIMLLATVLWTTEALPMAATGLACVALLPLVGATKNLSGALSGFAQPVPYFLYGVLVLGLAAGKSGLAERIARWFLALAQGRPKSLYWQLICSFAALATILPSGSTRTGLQLPIYHEALTLMGAGPGSRLGKAVMQALAQLNRLGSNALLTGGITPVTAAALLGGFTWGGWFALMAVPVYSNLILGAVAVYLSYRPFETVRAIALPARAASAPDKARTRAAEMRAGAILLGVSALWLTDSWHHLDPALPALFGAILMVTPGLGVLTWNEVERGVGVSLVFVMASSLSLARVVVDSGAAAWLGGWLVAVLRPVEGTPLLLVALLLVVCLVARVLLSSITAYLTVLIPVVSALSTAVGLNPLLVGLLVTFVGDSVVYYAAQASSSLLLFEYEYLTAADMLRLALIMGALAIGISLFIAVPYWALIGQPLVLVR